MTTTLRLAQVAGGAGGSGVVVDAVTSVTVSDTRIRAYTYAASAVGAHKLIRIIENGGDGGMIEQPLLVANQTDYIYIGDDGVRAASGNSINVSAPTTNAKVYIYYG